jgi:HAMP domain-containing protein
VVTAVACYLTSEAITQFAVRDATNALNFVINNIRSTYSHELQYLDTLANGDGFCPFRKEVAQDFARDFLLYENMFATMHMYAANGDLIFAEKRPSVPAYVIEANFYQKPDAAYIKLARTVLEQERPAASETFFTSSNDLYQTYITPVFTGRDHKKIFGLLSGGVFPHRQKVDRLLSGLKLGQDNFILITDSHGRLMASDGIAEAQVQGALKPYIEKAVQTFYKAGEARSRNQAAPPTLVDLRLKIGASRFVFMSLPIKELQLVVSVGMSTSIIDRKQEELFHRLLVALVMGLLFSLFASILIGERLSRPFRNIVSTVEKINMGNFAARADYSKNDEIGALSGLINTLAEKIEKSEYLGNLWSNESKAGPEPAGSNPGAADNNPGAADSNSSTADRNPAASKQEQ